MSLGGTDTGPGTIEVPPGLAGVGELLGDAALVRATALAEVGAG